MNTHVGTKRLLIAILCILSRFAYADSATDLAKKTQNPVEKMVTIPFNNNINYGYGTGQGVQYILDIKPVIPFSLSSSWNIISRTIIPLMNQPNLFSGEGYITGTGDINPTLYLSPAHPGPLIWGIGPTMVLPTANHPQLGQGKYSLGPSAVVLMMPNNWVVGVLAFNVWSIGGQSSRPDVNQFQFQYFINYNFPHGWYVTSQPTLSANWKASGNNRWLVPFGIGAGHVFAIGKQAMNASVQAYRNVKSPQIGPNWQLELNISFLFPET